MTDLLTAGTLKTEGLDRSLDLLALHGWQQQVLNNRLTPSLDSIAEALEAVQVWTPPSQDTVLSALLQRLSGLQAAEGRILRGLSGFLDPTVRNLRARELAGVGSELIVRAIARRLRGPLGTIAGGLSERTPEELARAHRAVGEVYGALPDPDAQLFTPAVAHELGAEKYSALCRLYRREAVAV